MYYQLSGSPFINGRCTKSAVFQFENSGLYIYKQSQFLYFVIGQKTGFLSAPAKEF
jgi:hypothetical protein